MSKPGYAIRALAAVFVLTSVCAGRAAAAAEKAPAPRARVIYVTCDNAPSDAAKINQAIADSPEGAEIVICGRGLINQPILLRGRRAYRGLSRAGTVLKQAPGANLPALLASDTFLKNKTYTGTPLSVRHLTLDGNKTQNPKATTAGIALRSWSSVVEDVTIRSMPGDGIRLTSVGVSGARLKTSQVNGRIAGCFISGCGRHGVFVEDPVNAVTDWTLVDNWIAGAGADAIHLDNAAGWMISRNHLYGVHRYAIYAHRAFATTISDNYIEGFGAVSERGAWAGMYVTLQGGAATTIANNRIFNFGLRRRARAAAGSTFLYIALRVNYGVGVASVTGNALRGAGADAETALHFAAKPNTRLIAATAGNVIADIPHKRFVGPRVTVTSGE